MSLLFRVIYATHANGTHHKLALDALQRLTRADAEAWQRLFLKHVELYLQGSKAPDNEFKDFKNHVLHVRDDYWGGAPEKVASWYQHLVTALREANWSEAAWCAGVLSHYYTDPIHPFHTAQSEAENNIHRAVEWSINRGYDSLKRDAEAAHRGELIEAPTGPLWLKDFVCRGAEKSNAQYEKLIAHYDINVGVVDPPAGLDALARELVGDLIVYAADGYARVLEHAIAEAEATPPRVSLSLETLLATLKIPLKAVQKKLADAEDRRIVEAMYDELMATGRVEKALPEDDRMVRDLHAREVLAKREQARTEVRDRRLPQVPAARPSPLAAVAPAASAAGATPQMRSPSAAPPPIPQPRAPQPMDDPRQRYAAALAGPSASTSVPVAGTLSERMKRLAFPERAQAEPMAPAPAVALKAEAMSEPAPERAAAPPPPPNLVPQVARSSASRAPRIYLSAADDIEAAPSIGAKTAERFYALGIHTVADLLATDAETAAELIDARHITASTITDWQDQARLVMAVPGLRGTHAQLLVGAGYRTADAIGDADAGTLSAALLRFAATSDGQRILRDGETPDIERIKGWIENAAAVRAA